MHGPGPALNHSDGLRVAGAGLASVAACRRVLWMILSLLLWNPAEAAPAAEPSPPPPAKFLVRGCGWIGNRQLRNFLRIPGATNAAPGALDANFVEDAAVMLRGHLEQKGYLEPSLHVQLTDTAGTTSNLEWAWADPPAVPRDRSYREVRFQVRRGIRFSFGKVGFHGLTALKAGEAERFFAPNEFLLGLRGARPFSASRLEQGRARLQQVLRLAGYAQATVTAQVISRDARHGIVTVELHVDEGTRTLVRAIHVENPGLPPGAPQPDLTGQRLPHPFSTVWQMDLERALKAGQARTGHLDATVQLELSDSRITNGVANVDAAVHVTPGTQYRVGDVRLEGLTRTRPGIVRRRISIEIGDVLDRSAAERSRQKLARLGVFDRVGMRIEPSPDPGERDVVYEFKEGLRTQVRLLAGFGSYELLRGGVEAEQLNVLGLAHTVRLRAIQSFKSTSGDLLYSMPDLSGSELTAFLEGTGLRREEVNFVREEYGAGAGVRRYFGWLASDLGLRYSQEVLGARHFPLTLTNAFGEVLTTDTNTLSRAGAFIFDLRHDARDNPLNPRHGFKLFGTAEFASPALGGDVDYQRLELSASIHLRLGGGRYLHLGANHGAILTPGNHPETIPLNKRFLLGGENSIRGYQRGEASPLDDRGEPLGATCYVLGNIELEQALTPSWSIVGFLDAVTFASDLRHYPGDESLFSAGGGVRWNTLIGPVRLEYGHNLNPRHHDPQGTIHFSLGFPF